MKQIVANKWFCVTATKSIMLLPAYLQLIIWQVMGAKSDFTSTRSDSVAMKSDLITDEVPDNSDEVRLDGDKVPGNWNLEDGK